MSTINEHIREALKSVPGIIDFYYAEPDKILSNEKVNYPALFRLLRNEDTITENVSSSSVTQNEYFMLAQPVNYTPMGDKEEQVENDLTRLAFLFLAQLKKQGVTFALVPTLKWGRRDLGSYAVCLIFRINIADSTALVGECVTQKYTPEPIPTDEC